MRTEKIEVYKFSELNKKAQEKVISDYRAEDELTFFSEDFTEYAKDYLQEKYAFNPDEIRFSLSYSQGDGVSFTEKGVNIEEFIKKNNIKGFDLLIKLNQEPNLIISLETNSLSNMYQHENTVNIEYNLYPDNSSLKTDKLIGDFIAVMEEIRFNACKELEKNGYKQIEDLQSEEYIKEAIETNEYEYTKDGKQWVGG